MASRVRIYLQSSNLWPGVWYSGKSALKTLEALACKKTKTIEVWAEGLQGRPFLEAKPTLRPSAGRLEMRYTISVPSSEVAPLPSREGLPLWKQAIVLYRSLPLHVRGSLQMIVSREGRGAPWQHSAANPVRWGHSKPRRPKTYAFSFAVPAEPLDDFAAIIAGNPPSATPVQGEPRKKRPFKPSSRPSVGIWA